MARALSAALVLGLLWATAAVAATGSGLRLSGRVTPELRVWMQDAAPNVPLPRGQLTIRNGSPMYAARSIFLPFSWGGHAVRGLLLHELGHVYDAQSMTPPRRARFLELAGVTCAWKAPHCRTVRWVSGPDVYVDVRPEEMFAEMYAACALGLTESQYQDAGYRTYGWVPPEGTDASLCALIRNG